MLSLIFAGLTGIAVLGLLWPLVERERGRARHGFDLDLYRAQVAEIERDVAQGLVAVPDAEAAKAEAARRLLAAAEPSSGEKAPPSKWTPWVAGLAVLAFVPGFAFGLYFLIGSPELPDAPLAARLAAPPAPTDLAAAVAKIEAHLATHPDDARGYEVLGPVYLRMGRADDAAAAYAALLRLRGDMPEFRTSYGEALVYAARGDVTAEARKSFEVALAKDPSLVKARFYLGLAAEQDGDFSRAKEIWGSLLAEEPEDSPLALALRQRLEAMSVPPALQGSAAAEIKAMPEAERAKTIHAMVDRLASRLAENGQDLDGWLRLVRAYTVLNERDKAVSALRDAKRNLSNDDAAAKRIDALTRELGLEGENPS